MNRIIGAWAVILITIICVGSPFAQGRKGKPTAADTGQAKAAAKAVPIKSTVASRRSVEVTIYNNDMGLIKEERRIKVHAGEGELQFVDVPSAINPVTVLVRPLADADDFSILEQNYEYDLISHAKLMDKYVGKKIKIVDWNEYQDRKTTVDAELLSVNAGEVYKIGDEIYLGHPGTKVLPELPGSLISRPTLSWIYNSKASRVYPLEVSYLTSGMKWSADYILVFAESKGGSSLSGWVTIDNRSGAAYENAKLKLIAGEVNRVRPQLYGAGFKRGMREEMAMAAPASDMGFEASGMFEYHMYDLQRPTTVKENQTKQISLLEAHGLAVTREYVTSSSLGNNRPGSKDGSTRWPVVTFLKFKNTKNNNLGNPIPAGVIRLYTADAKGSKQFIGEDRVAHTPKDEEVKLRVGEAFDLVAEHTQVSRKQITTRISEIENKISLRNRKDEDVTIVAQETIYGTWEVAESSHKYTKQDANTIRFEVAVPKGQEVEVKFKIRTGI